MTDPAAAEARFTEDVDITSFTSSLTEFYKVEDKLRALGFVNKMGGGDPICRWTIKGTIVDIMPSNISLLGFNTKWYADAIKNSVEFEIEKGTKIKLISAPYFIATKIDASIDRAEGDYFHKDFEDIITVIDGREEVLAEYSSSPQSVRIFIAEWFEELLKKDAVNKLIESHLTTQLSGKGRVEFVIQRIRALIDKKRSFFVEGK